MPALDLFSFPKTRKSKETGKAPMNIPDNTICRRLRITGRVQGVGFRWSLGAEARALGLAGWVCNRHDGSVEALLVGRAEAVTALAEWARHGPPGSRVDSFFSQEENTAGLERLQDFEQRSTC